MKARVSHATITSSTSSIEQVRAKGSAVGASFVAKDPPGYCGVSPKKAYNLPRAPHVWQRRQERPLTGEPPSPPARSSELGTTGASTASSKAPHSGCLDLLDLHLYGMPYQALPSAQP